jgi:hypothetical protein
MISCTEFIPAYSEGFKYIETEGGRAELERFWVFLSDTYLKGSLDKLVSEEGLEGCFSYWSVALNEEAAGFRMEYNAIAGEHRGNLFDCPSKGMLLKLDYMEPHKDYCDHCLALYKPVLERHGYIYEKEIPPHNVSSCSSLIRVRRT